MRTLWVVAVTEALVAAPPPPLRQGNRCTIDTHRYNEDDYRLVMRLRRAARSIRIQADAFDESIQEKLNREHDSPKRD
jgi:hypothetical protein